MIYLILTIVTQLPEVFSYPFGAPGCGIRPNHGDILGNVSVTVHHVQEYKLPGQEYKVSGNKGISVS